MLSVILRIARMQSSSAFLCTASREDFSSPLMRGCLLGPLIRGCLLTIAEQVPCSDGDCSTSQCRHAQVVSALLSHPAAEGVVLAVLDPGEQADGDVFEGVSPNQAFLFGQTFHPTLVPFFLNQSQSFACSGGSGADRCLILSNTFILFLMCSVYPPAACPCPRSANSKHLSAVKLSTTVDARWRSRRR